MAEVAVELFQDTPSVFLQELRRGRYARVFSSSEDVAATISHLGLPEDDSSRGITLLPSKTVEELLSDRRRMELVQPLRLELMKQDSAEAVRLLGEGLPARALPFAVSAMQQGRSLFPPGPSPSLHLFPLHLLVSQAQLGANDCKGAGESLEQATWLVEECEDAATPAMLSQLARLKGQLHTLQNRLEQATQEFAREVYYASLQFGVEDARTAAGNHNLATAFKARGMPAEALRCCGHIGELLRRSLASLVFPPHKPAAGERSSGPGSGEAEGSAQAALTSDQVQELLRILLDVEKMYRDLASSAATQGPETRGTQEPAGSPETNPGAATWHQEQVAEGRMGATLARALAHVYLRDGAAAQEALQEVLAEAVGTGEEEAGGGSEDKVGNLEFRSLIRKLRIAIDDETEAVLREGAAAAA